MSTAPRPEPVTADNIARLLRDASFIEASGVTPGFRVWASRKYERTVYVQAVRSHKPGDYAYSFKWAKDHVAAYEALLKGLGYTVVREQIPRLGSHRLKVSLPDA